MSKHSLFLKGRKKSELHADLRQLAASWISNLDTNPESFSAATAILDVAAGFGAEVTDRLARTDEKIRLGFIDWLGGKPSGAVAATLPAVFKLKSSATKPVLARAPIKLQADAEGATVHMEALVDTLLIPGPSPSVVAADLGKDEFYRPYTAITSVSNKPNSIASWRLKDFADTGDTVIYLEPPLGLQSDDFIKIGDHIYRVAAAEGDKITIRPPLPIGSGFARDTEVLAVRSFAPFDNYLNEQQHIIYLGDEDLFNIPAETTITILNPPEGEVSWSYWGKKGDEGPAWQNFDNGQPLEKPKGDVEILEIKGIKSRWLRGVRTFQPGKIPADTPDSVRFLLSSTQKKKPIIAGEAPEQTTCDIKVFVNSTQALPTNFQPLGRVPRQGDSLYIGCAEAFSKPGAIATLDFELADIGINCFAVLPSDSTQNPVPNPFVTTISRNKELQLFELIAGKLKLRSDILYPLLQKDSSGNFIDLSPDVAPVIWYSAPNVINIVAARDKDIWHWKLGAGFSQLTGLPRDNTVAADDTNVSRIRSLGVYFGSGKTHVVCVRNSKAYELSLDGVADWVFKSQIRDIVSVNNSTLLNELLVIKEPLAGSFILAKYPGGTSNTEASGIQTDILPCNTTLTDGQSTTKFTCYSIKVGQGNNVSRQLIVSPSSGGNGVSITLPEGSILPRAALHVLGVSEATASVVLKGKLQNADNDFIDVLFVWFAWLPQLDDKLFYVPLVGLAGEGDFFTAAFSDQILLPSANGGGIRGLTISAPVGMNMGSLDPNVKVLQLALGQLTWQSLYERDFTAPSISAEYWNGSGWHPLNFSPDETKNLARSGKIKFPVPQDLSPTTWMGVTNHWIALRLAGGNYGEEVVTVTTTQLSGGAQTQSVKTDISGIKPPFAEKLSVYYDSEVATKTESGEQVGGWLPTYLLTEDSGNVRNQSEANATTGINTEIFSPLQYGLREFVQSNESTTHRVDAECGCLRCNEQLDENAALSTENQLRAIYIGIAQNVSGGPIRFFIEVASERNFESCGGLIAEALVEGRYVGCTIEDETHGLGESGMLTFVIPEAPTPTELFGQTKCWIRLRPESNVNLWNPDLKRLLANAAWLLTGESIRDEPLGTSDGSTSQKLRVSRAPLFARSLDLRIHEHLSSEERAALTAKDSTAVTADASDNQKLWVRWTEVDDTLDYGPRDRVYSIDGSTGVIQFGDGRHGSIPPTTFGGIKAALYRRWEPASNGQFAGNALAYAAPLNLISAVNGVEEVLAARNSSGGTSGQTTKNFISHFGNRIRHQGRALSTRDCEQLILSRFPQVAQVRCISRNKEIQVIVVAPDRGFSQQLAREIRNALESNSLLQAASCIRFRVMEATPLKIGLSLTVLIPDVAMAAQVTERLKEVLKALFDARLGGRNGLGWPLGVSPNASDILAVATEANPDCSVTDCKLIQKDTLTVHDWQLAIATNQLVQLDRDDIKILPILLEDPQ